MARDGVDAMGEGGIIEKFLGVEGEEVENDRAAPAADPIAAAVAIDAARFDPRLAGEAADYLAEQRRLVSIQAEHLHEQREVQLSHLKLRRTGERLRVGLQLFLVAIGTLIGLGVLVALYDAFTSDSVVVNAFKAPAALASRGLTGDVVAASVLDGLEKLQESTRGPRQGLRTRNAWSSDIKIEVPETGVSIGELDRMLHERFGHDVHIDGDLVQTATGLALTVRGDGVPARTFAGTSDQLSSLVTVASEYIYGSSQPWLFAIYLASNNRSADALHFLPDAFRRATTDEQRAELANVWGVAFVVLDQSAPAVAKFELAMSLVLPRSQIWWKAWGNIIGALNADPSAREAQWQESRKILEAVEQAPEDQRPQVRLLTDAAYVTWDLPLLRKALLQDASRNGGAGSSSSIVAPQLANVSALMHEPESAERWIAASDPGDPLTETQTAQLMVYTALARGDPSGAIAPAHTVFDAWLAHSRTQFIADGQCFLGLAEGLAGDTARAATDFARAGAWPRCFAFYGDVLAHSGDVAGALRKWADGLRLAPDQMLIYLHRGLFELSSGDTQAALADFAAASARAPHYADPLKAWGDTLARVGRWREALAKYDAAIAYAPAWLELRQARAAAAKRA